MSPSTSEWTRGRGVDDKDYKLPFRFTGKLDKLTIKLGPSQMVAEDQKAKAETMARVND
jgi:hypothetical protein